MHFMAVKKSRNRLGFVVYLHFKDCSFTTVKEMQSSKLGIRKGYYLSIEGIRTGYLFGLKCRYIKG